MRPLREMETIQIDITNHCMNRCSNCTRLVGHHRKPYFMGYDYFKRAIDSLVDFKGIVGIMGGEPLLHSEFKKFCKYALSRIPRERLGLWSCFPKGKEKYRNSIVKTFGQLFLNDHREDIVHKPIMVSPYSLGLDSDTVENNIWNCWVQNTWSASINPNGAFFCEVAGSLGILFDNEGWNVEPNWWRRFPYEYRDQMFKACNRCSLAQPVYKRNSTDKIDDIDKNTYRLLKDKSPKIMNGDFKIYDGSIVEDSCEPAKYRNADYRNNIALKYGIKLKINSKQYSEPVLIRGWKA